ncbi:hypothetical protein UP09_03290 [Bradyrhizobium sp. LTSP885]|uniref:virion core protein, T7 gp14 family n=1 Tax=Bradyrhizobium sp. LTSP885 TaxID=1619232 RepID=UPI0005C7F464|nr:hypothetical protein [Bradyrhizobium sp. LTSP885]KJC51083.1 hypothetical protein UP09_03290 [Bradyrhizobium sp. LTSP885]
MWADLALSGGLSALRNGMSYKTAKEDADAKQKWQDYKNTMTKLSLAANQNVLVTNANMARDASAEQQFSIERSAYLTEAQAEASAAAAGVGGRSVNDVLFDIDNNAAMAQSRRKADLKSQYLQIDNQNTQSTWQAAMQMDYSPIPQPNPATYMLNFATDATKLWQSSRPK